MVVVHVHVQLSLKLCSHPSYIPLFSKITMSDQLSASSVQSTCVLVYAFKCKY